MSKSFDDLSWDELMELEAKQSEPLSLSDEDVRHFNHLTVLYKMDQHAYQIPVLGSENSEFLNDVIQEMMAEGLLEMDSRNYRVSQKGRQTLETMAQQYHSLVEHYDVFAHVDLDHSRFLEPGDDPNAQVLIDGQHYPQFIDLRVAVMRFKGISPFDMVFLNLLREGRIAKAEGWEFDMALGKALYAELEEIVNSAYTVKDLTALGKTNDNGEIPGSDILKDVIVAGNQLNQQRKQQTQSRNNGSNGHKSGAGNALQIEVSRPQQHVVHEPLFVEYHYEPYGYYDYYYDPFYVEPVWRHHHYRPWF